MANGTLFKVKYRTAKVSHDNVGKSKNAVTRAQDRSWANTAEDGYENRDQYLVPTHYEVNATQHPDFLGKHGGLAKSGLISRAIHDNWDSVDPIVKKMFGDTTEAQRSKINKCLVHLEEGQRNGGKVKRGSVNGVTKEQQEVLEYMIAEHAPEAMTWKQEKATLNGYSRTHQLDNVKTLTNWLDTHEECVATLPPEIQKQIVEARASLNPSGKTPEWMIWAEQRAENQLAGKNSFGTQNWVNPKVKEGYVNPKKGTAQTPVPGHKVTPLQEHQVNLLNILDGGPAKPREVLSPDDDSAVNKISSYFPEHNLNKIEGKARTDNPLLTALDSLQTAQDPHPLSTLLQSSRVSLSLDNILRADPVINGKVTPSSVSQSQASFMGPSPSNLPIHGGKPDVPYKDAKMAWLKYMSNQSQYQKMHGTSAESAPDSRETYMDQFMNLGRMSQEDRASSLNSMSPEQIQSIAQANRIPTNSLDQMKADIDRYSKRAAVNVR